MEWYIDIDTNAIPYSFEMKIDGATYRFEVYYNSLNDYFTIDLYKGNEHLILGEKIIYGKPLFEDVFQTKIIPLDLSNEKERVGWDELNERVFLYLEGEDYA